MKGNGKSNNTSADYLVLFDEARDAIDESLVRLSPWLDHQINEHLTLGGILRGLRKTLTSIKERSLSASLEEWIEAFREKHLTMGVKVTYYQLGVELPLSDLVENELICVFQEACGNALHHGKADVIQILFMYQRDSLKVTISDNGSGNECVENLQDKREGSGLDSIKARVEKVGGQVEFINKQNDGKTGFVIITTLPAVCLHLDSDEFKQEGVLGHELHDYLCPEMIGLVMILASIRRKLTEDDSEMWYEVHRAEEKLSEYANSFRELSHQLIE